MLGDGELISGAFHSLFWLGIVTIHEEFSKYHWNFSLLAYLQTSTIKINTLLLLWALPSSVGGGGWLGDNVQRKHWIEPARQLLTRSNYGASIEHEYTLSFRPLGEFTNSGRWNLKQCILFQGRGGDLHLCSMFHSSFSFLPTQYYLLSLVYIHYLPACVLMN